MNGKAIKSAVKLNETLQDIQESKARQANRIALLYWRAYENGKDHIKKAENLAVFSQLVSLWSDYENKRKLGLKTLANKALSKYDKTIKELSKDNYLEPGFTITDRTALKYERFKMRSIAIKNCHNFVELGINKDDFTDNKIAFTYSCDNILCPICIKRKSKIFLLSMLKILDQDIFKNVGFVFGTLTLKNVSAEDLKSACEALTDNMGKLYKSHGMDYEILNPNNKRVLGGSWVLEITHDNKEFIDEILFKTHKKYFEKLGLKHGDKNPNFNTYHPHIHFLCLVEKDYFKKESNKYITHNELMKAWRKVNKLDYDPFVHIEAIKTKSQTKTDGQKYRNALSELCKYMVKSSDIQNVETLFNIDNAIVQPKTDGQRPIRKRSFFGCLYGQMAKLEEAENLQKVNKDDLEALKAESKYMRFVLNFDRKLNEYVVNQTIKPNELDLNQIQEIDSQKLAVLALI